jgi:hypothetical protein
MNTPCKFLNCNGEPKVQSYRVHGSDVLSYFIGCNKWTPGTRHRCIRIHQNINLENLKEMFENNGRLAEINVNLLNYPFVFVIIQYIYYVLTS